MEFMEGEDLSVVVTRRGPFSVEVAVGYLLEACEAIAEAHSYGIVHRDIKPANLFLAKQPNGRAVVKVLDFGISKSTLSTTQAQLTQTTQVMGSPYYMSPEQMISAKSVDVRSDIWALGIVLYEFLTARVPFQSDTLPELIAAVLQREHEPLRTVRPDVPPELEAVVHRCLAKDPAVRYANVAELAAALAPFGPARSNISVERITSVLGLAGPPPPSDAAPPLLSGTAGMLGQTGPRAATGAQVTPVPTAAAGDKGFAFATGATTTAKPLSSDATPLPPGVSGPKGVWVVVAAGAAIVVIGTLGTIGWRLSASRSATAAATPSASAPAASSSEAPSPTPSQTAAASGSAPAASDSASAAATPSAAPSSAPPSSETAAAAPATPPRAGGHTTPAEPAAPAVRPSPPPDRPHPAPGTNCTVVTDYDSAGQPHFKKVCK